MIQPLDTGRMNNAELGRLIREAGDEVEGEEGSWRFRAHGVVLFCITDPLHDRMRVMTPIAGEDELGIEVLKTCMEANFDRALDARYCLHDGTLWGAFIHPLGDLTPELFHSAIHQVAEVKKNFGTSFASGTLTFGGEPDTS